MTSPAGTPITAVNLEELDALAQAVLPAGLFAYFAGGAGDELTLQRNRAAFRRWQLHPRILTGVTEPSLHTSVLGREVALPVLLAPVGFQGLARAEGEVLSARAATSAGTLAIAPTLATCTLEECAAAGAGWFQLYVLRDRDLTAAIVRRAEAAGYWALVFTVDAPVPGRRERDARSHYVLPPDARLANFSAEAGMPVPPPPPGTPMVQYIAGLFDPAISWPDLAWLRSLTSLPVIVKGVLHAEDACLAVEHGAAAVVVSNHGGRQLDPAPAGIEVLERIVAAVDGRCEVYVDGGVRRGTDVLTALALGARAVLIGRPFLWGLSVDGESGVRRVLEMLTDELRTALILCGIADVHAVPRSLLLDASPV